MKNEEYASAFLTFHVVHSCCFFNVNTLFVSCFEEISQKDEEKTCNKLMR